MSKHITTVHPNAGRRGLEAKIREAGINKDAIWANHGAYIAHYRIQDRLRGQMNQKPKLQISIVKVLRAPVSNTQLN